MRNMLMKVLVGTGLALSLGPAFADAMCGPNGEFNPMTNQCYPIQRPGGNKPGPSGPTYLPPEPQWGAIAIDMSRQQKSSGFSNSKKSQAQANKEALDYCGLSTCKVVLTFKNSCGAIAGSDVGIWGGGVDTDKNRALEKAAASCYAKGSKTCFKWVQPSCAGAPRK